MAVELVVICQQQAGQRIDNFLLSRLKGVPKSRIYRAIRKGEVRVNKGRIKAEYRLQSLDQVRVPPLRTAQQPKQFMPSAAMCDELSDRILIENDEFLIINKPSGLSVHGGSGVDAGLIEILRQMRPQQAKLELAHRLDRETSGCLLIAKQRQLLLEFHAALVDKKVEKKYLALVMGQWSAGERQVCAPLKKNVLRGGERLVTVDFEAGKSAQTLFQPIKQFRHAALVAAYPITGRTHQIRAHAAHIGFPIAGDRKYGDNEFNKQLRTLGLKRLFLHSSEIRCLLASTEVEISVAAQLDEQLLSVLQNKHL